jgi:hypothetical protein
MDGDGQKADLREGLAARKSLGPAELIERGDRIRTGDPHLGKKKFWTAIP